MLVSYNRCIDYRRPPPTLAPFLVEVERKNVESKRKQGTSARGGYGMEGGGERHVTPITLQY